MVFRPEAAPKTRDTFITWFHKQTEWVNDRNYNDLSDTSSELSDWFLEMIKTFPTLNGPFATDDIDNPKNADYSIGKDFIYVGFAWSVLEEAHDKAVELAKKYGVGFFECSADDGDIMFPQNGWLIPIDSPSKSYTDYTYTVTTYTRKKKPWWKFWG